MKKFTRQQARRPIRASTLNDPIEAFERSRAGMPGGSIVKRDFGGVELYDTIVPERFPARIDSGGTNGQYTVTEVQAVDGGGWTPPVNPRVVSAWEYNRTSGLVAGTIVDVRREQGTGEYRFLMGACQNPVSAPVATIQQRITQSNRTAIGSASVEQGGGTSFYYYTGQRGVGLEIGGGAGGAGGLGP